MTTIESTVDINASKDKVWAALADFGNIQNFHPGLKSSHSTSSEKGGLGATRQCILKPMGTIQERIIDWNEGESLLIDIYEGKNMPPLDFGRTRALFTVQEKGKQTAVTMKMMYETKGFVGSAMNPMLKSQFEKTVPTIIKGLKYYVENGKTPTSKDVKQMASAA